MEQRKLNDQANTLVDLAKVSMGEVSAFMVRCVGMKPCTVTDNALGGGYPNFELHIKPTISPNMMVHLKRFFFTCSFPI